MRSLLAALALLLAASTPGCRPTSNERTAVVVSIFPVYDLARRVAGPDADVTLVVPPGTEVHTYAPSAHDQEVVKKAHLGVMVGLGLDAWMETLMTGARPRARTLKVADRVPQLKSSEPGGADEGEDPYVWMDPERARLVVRAIAEEMGRVDATHAVAYRERATVVDTSLGALDTEVEQATKGFTHRAFVTEEPAFAYFAERYKLDVAATIGPHLDKEKVLGAMKAKAVVAVFARPEHPRPEVEALATAAGAKVGVLDAFGGTGSAASYEALIRSDVASLQRLLK